MRLLGNRSQPDAEFEAYCLEVLPRIKALALSVTANQADADDIAIETLARLFVRWTRLSKVSWRDGWVLRVAANLSIDLLRRQQRAEPEKFAPVEVTTPEHQRVEFVDALRHLPRRQQEVVVLRFYGDLSYSDIAQRLHISAGSVKTHLHRGLAGIRKEFEMDEQQGGPRVERTI